jgi:transposase-like protein
MALETGNMTSIARKAGISRDTLRVWMKIYEEEVREVRDQEGVTPSQIILLKMS